MTDTWFDPHQRAAVAAAMERIIPSDDTPGAREAGTIDFLDRYLSGIGHVYAKPDGSGFETLTGKRADAWRQRIDTLRRTYADGVEKLDGLARQGFGPDFAQLAGEQQDEVLRALEAGQDRVSYAATGEQIAQGYGGVVTDPALQQTNAEVELPFFGLLCLHTRQGFYADPVYGGNRGRVGWETIGFPGPESMADVHSGRYSTLDWFAEDRVHPGTEVAP